MDRIPSHRYAPDINRALDITRRFRRYIGDVHFLCGVDPIFAGLHTYTVTTDGRSYRDTAHCTYRTHQTHMPADRRWTTIVLPQPVKHWVIVHEIGHAVDEALRFEHTAEPVSDYAQTNRWEAFAEAFTSYLYHGYGDRPDAQTLALLDSL